MYQVYIPFGKSAGTDVQFLQVPATTPLPEGTVGLLIGEGTKLNAPMVTRYATDAGLHTLLNELKEAVVVDQFAVLFDPVTQTTATGATSVGSETRIGAAVNLSAYKATQSVLVSSGITQCLEVLRETLNLGGGLPSIKA